ncbi:MAG: dual specificity protein phosphatase family protein [Acidobacteriota bacterium]
MNMKNYVNNGFSWVIEKELGGMAFPGFFDPAGDMKVLFDMEITLLVTLTLEVPDPGMLRDTGIRSVHYPVKDFHAPTVKQLNEFCLRADKEIDAGGRVAVHCHAGKGRTGTFLAAYFVFKGAEADGAIELIRKLRPGSIETEEQENSVRKFYQYLSEK